MSGNSEEIITEPRVFLPHGHLIVMGEAKCGKTSLVRALTKGKAKERTTRGNSIPTVDVHLVNEQWNSLDFKELLLGDFSWVFWRIFLAQLLYLPLFMELACCGDFRKFERIEQLTKFEIDPFYSWRCRWFNSLSLDNHKVKAGMLVQLLFITALYQLSLWQIVGRWCIVAPVLLMLTTELLRQAPVLLRKKRLEVCSFTLIGLIFGSLIVHCWLFNEGGIDYDNTFLILTLLYCFCLPHSQFKQSKRGVIPKLVSVLSIVQYFVITYHILQPVILTLLQCLIQFYVSTSLVQLGSSCVKICKFIYFVILSLFCFWEAPSKIISVSFSRSLFPKTDFVLDMLDLKADLFALMYTLLFVLPCGLALYSEESCLKFVMAVVFVLLCFHLKYILELASDLQAVHKDVFVAEVFCALLLFIGYFRFCLSFVYLYFVIFALLLLHFSAHIYGRWMQVKGYFGDMSITKYFAASWHIAKLTFQKTQFRFCIIFHFLLSICVLFLDNIWYGPETSLQLRLLAYIFFVCILPLKLLYQLLYSQVVELCLIFTVAEFMGALFYLFDVGYDSPELLERRYTRIKQWNEGQAIYNFYGIHQIGIVDVAVSVITIWHQFSPVLLNKETDGILDCDIQMFSEVQRQEILKREYTKEVFEAFAAVRLQITDLTGDPEHYHHLIVPKDSLCMYVIVFNLKNMVEDNFRNAEDLISRIAFLLQSVYSCITNNTPTFIVATNCAGISPNSMAIVSEKFENSPCWLLFCDWIQHGKFVFHPVDTDQKLLEGVESLQRNIMKKLIYNASKCMDHTVPLSRIILQDNILQLRHNLGFGSTCINIDGFNNMVETSLGNFTPDDLEYLQKKGMIIYADHEEKKWVCLQPQTVFNIFLCMSNIPASIVKRRGCQYGAKLLQKEGILTKALLSCIASLFQENCQGMTMILENCELIFPLKLKAQQTAEKLHTQEQTCWGQENGSKEETHFVPALLPKLKPKHSIWEKSPDDKKLYVASHRFLPKQFFYRFMSLAHTRSLTHSADNRPQLYQDEGMFWLGPQQPYMAKFLQHEGLIEITFSRLL